MVDPRRRIIAFPNKQNLSPAKPHQKFEFSLGVTQSLARPESGAIETRLVTPEHNNKRKA